MRVSLIAAVAENGTIGRDGSLPWHLPDDLKRFRALTTGHHVIMGRRTFESIGRPLPQRTSLVISRDPRLRIDGARVLPSVEAALQHARAAGEKEAFVIGGASIYAAALPIADRLYLTKIAARVDGDAFFPPIDEGDWTLQSSESHAADDRHAHAFSLTALDRVPGKRPLSDQA